MFDRRLKIILSLLTLVVVALGARAMQIQVIEHSRWTDEAAELLTERKTVETTRGRILDRRNNVLAQDDPCIDACVYYAAIADDSDGRAKWLASAAQTFLNHEYGKSFGQLPSSQRKQLLAEREQYLADQLPQMWALLQQVSGKTAEQIDAARHAIINRVEMRRQSVWWQNYRNALAKHSGDLKNMSWMGRWWNDSQVQDASEFDNFAVDVAEQSQAHVIVSDVDSDSYNVLAKYAERFPALVLQPSRHRVYPFGRAACHIMGRMTAVTEAQLKADPDPDNPLRRYYPNDLIGQGGVEALCEGALRGTRGEIVETPGAARSQTTDAVPGSDVHLTVDVDLQEDCAQFFAQRRPQHLDSVTGEIEYRQNQHGAAVVIDVPTSQVLAMVSCPTFDPATFATQYRQLLNDDLNNPLLNRATMAQYEPGSTAKTMMGLGALTDGLITPSSTVECTGYLVIDGRRQEFGKCWTMREYGPKAARHAIPKEDPHPTGFLNVTDAIERSCNVFFETLADKMGMERQHFWYDQFGLGRPTGIGLPEIAGMIPDPARVPRTMLRQQTWFCGIGQGRVMATPLQMANAAATIARGGIWMRPRIVSDQYITPASGRPALLDRPSRVDLKLSPTGYAAVKQGMIEVVNDKAGTAYWPKSDQQDALDSIVIAGKTGTPQAPTLSIFERDESGNKLIIDGKPKRRLIAPGTAGTTDWYMGDGPLNRDLSHAWFIGFAPADHPQIAFAVFVEYGARGGANAAGIARDVLESCIKRGYLRADGDLHVRLQAMADAGLNQHPSLGAPSEPIRPDDLVLSDDPTPGSQGENEDYQDMVDAGAPDSKPQSATGDELIHGEAAPSPLAPAAHD